MKKKIIKLVTKIKSDSFWQKLFKNSLHVFVGDSTASLINVIITIILIKILGNNLYGYLVLAIGYMTIMDAIINLQSWKGVIHYGQDALVKNDSSRLIGYVKLGTILDVSTAILCFLISYFLAPLIGNIFGWDPHIIICSQIMSFVIISHFSGTPTAVLRIFNKFNLVAVQKIISSIIKLSALLVILLFKLDLNIYIITWLYAITDIIGNLLLVILSIITIKKQYKLIDIAKVELPANKKEFTKFTIWTTLSEIVDIPVQQIDVFIVAKLGIDMVSIFKVFKQIASIISKLMIPIQQAIMPQFSELIAKGKVRLAYENFLKIHKYLIIIFIPIALIIGLSSFMWLDLVFSSGYSKYWYVLLLLLISQSIAFSYSTIHPLFISMKNVFYSFVYGLITNIVYLIVALILVNKMQMVGLIIAFTIQYSLLIYLKNRKIKKQIGGYYETTA